MSEHARANGYQWVDADVYMLWDLFHDQPDRIGGAIFATKEEAINAAISKRWETRTIILKVPAIVARRIAPEVKP